MPRTAVVTGASSGIGAATAAALAAKGFAVVCAARRKDRVEAVAERVDGTAVVCDVTDDASVAALAEVVGDSLHVLVNNAGGARGMEQVADGDVEAWRWMYDVNVLGALRVTKALLPALGPPATGSWSTSARRPAGTRTRAAVATPRPSTASR